MRDQGKGLTPPRAKTLAPDTAIRPPSPPHNAPPYSDIHDAGPNIVVGVHGVIFAPTDEHIATATQRALTYVPPQHPKG
jgi:hypothetical protein